MIRRHLRRLFQLLFPSATEWPQPRRPGKASKAGSPRRPYPGRFAFRPAFEALDPRVVPTVTFGGPNSFAVGTTPVASTLADLNGDGRLDLVVVNSDSNSISVLLNTTTTGSVTPSFGAQQTFAAGTSPFSVAVGDFNGDGKPDLVVANYNSNTVSVLLNTTPKGSTSVSFAPQVTFAVGSFPQAVAVGDFNGDGKPDLAVANVNDNTVSILLNTAAATATIPSFAAQLTFAVGTSPIFLAVADLNGDGKADLAVTNFGSNSVSVLVNQTAAGATTASFAAQQTFATGGSPIPVVVADFNGDGRPDLAVANSATNSVSILMNTTAVKSATVSFAAQQTFAVGTSPEGLAVGDFDADGRPDLAVANFNDNTVSELTNTTLAGFTTASFSAQQTFAAGTAPLAMTIGDLNGDGRPDFLTVNNGSATATALLNTTSSLTTKNPSVVVQSGAQGVSQLNLATKGFSPSTGASASLLAVNAQGFIAGEFPGHGVWLFTPTIGWSQINGFDATALAIDPLGDVSASFPGFGTAEFIPHIGVMHWQPLSPATASLLAMDGNGDTVAVFPGLGVWEFLPATGLMLINGYDATSLAMNAAGQVSASFPGFGVGLFLPGAGWELINGHAATALAIDSFGDVSAQFAGVGVAEYLFSAYGWRVLPGAPAINAVQLGMDALGDTYAAFPGNGLWEFDPTRGWIQLTATDASVLSVA